MALFSACADVLHRTHRCYNIQLCEMFVLRHVVRWCLQLVTILVPKHVAEAKTNWYAPSVGVKESVIA